jgi:hypothetical protein
VGARTPRHHLDQQRRERAREVATDERGSIPVWFRKWISLETNVLAEYEFQTIEPLNLRAGMRLRGLGNMVDLTGIEPVTS